MVDVFSKKKRSEIMSRVRSRMNRATELYLIRLFRENGIIGWRRNHPLFGKPDFVFPKERIVVFVDGEFWHGHPTRGQIPKTNTTFWREKIAKNKRRDRIVNRTLREKKWVVVRIWQYELHNSRWHRKIKDAFKAAKCEHKGINRVRLE